MSDLLAVAVANDIDLSNALFKRKKSRQNVIEKKRGPLNI